MVIVVLWRSLQKNPITKETFMLETFSLRDFFGLSTTNSFIIELMVQNNELLILVFSKHTINSSVLSVFEKNSVTTH